MWKLTDLEPSSKQRIIDALETADVDVSEWSKCKGGKARASRNPRHCYNWAFVQPGKVVVLNLWHDRMEEFGDRIVMKTNMREFASRHSGPVKRRALAMDAAIRTAFEGKLTVRVIILGGRRRNISKSGAETVRATKRMLDPVGWTVTEYEPQTGYTVLTRDRHRFADQFSNPQEPDRTPERRAVSGQAFKRNQLVRYNVLVRANGKCEWCGKEGFRTADGTIFLETHHVIPLSERGHDAESNVAALCPNHHREAHHGEGKGEMRQELLERVRNISNR